jgi:hypothetical protein|tara:strand:+ start:93 stop:323 length:231 start_codon:yes stop_codon:yes gene_type:complete
MDYTTAIIFIGFIIINSWFSFRAGEKAGRYEGMLMGFRFLKDKNALRDKIDIIGFNQWPMPLQQMYVDPDHVEIDD